MIRKFEYWKITSAKSQRNQRYLRATIFARRFKDFADLVGRVLRASGRAIRCKSSPEVCAALNFRVRAFRCYPSRGKGSIYFIALFVLLSIQSYSQKENSFSEFLNLFPKAELPLCIEYPDSTLSFEELPEEFQDSTGSRIQVVDGILEKDSSLAIPDKFVLKYLLGDSESLYYQDEFDTSKYFYSPVCLVYKTHNFYGLVYEKQFWINYYSFSEKYFCSFNRNGKIISKVLIAHCGYGGLSTYDDDDGDPDSYLRVPFFLIEEGCFSTNNSFTYKLNGGNEKKYSINTKGIITEIK
jgi:hypothetical protein